MLVNQGDIPQHHFVPHHWKVDVRQVTPSDSFVRFADRYRQEMLHHVPNGRSDQCCIAASLVLDRPLWAESDRIGNALATCKEMPH